MDLWTYGPMNLWTCGPVVQWTCGSLCPLDLWVVDCGHNIYHVCKKSVDLWDCGPMDL